MTKYSILCEATSSRDASLPCPFDGCVVLPASNTKTAVDRYCDTLQKLELSTKRIPSLPDLIVLTDPDKRAEAYEAIRSALVAAEEEKSCRRHLQRVIRPENVDDALSEPLRRGRDLNKKVQLTTERALEICQAGDGIPSLPPVLKMWEVNEIYASFYPLREQFWIALYSVPFIREYAINELRGFRERDKKLAHGGLLLLNRDESEEQLMMHVDTNLTTATLLLERHQRRPNRSDPVKVARLLVETPLVAETLATLMDEVSFRTQRFRKLHDELQMTATSGIDTPSDWQERHEEYLRLSEQLGGGVEHAEAQCSSLEALRKPYQRLKDYIANSNRRLVGKIAHRYEQTAGLQEDLVQDGVFGLMRAIEKYDASSGHSFSTLASWWISQAILRKRDFYRHPIQVPHYQRALLGWLAHLNPEEQRLSSHELGKRSQTDPAIIASLRLRLGSVESLSPSDGERVGRGATLPDRQQPSTADIAQHRELQGRLEGALLLLDPRSREVIRMRYGLGGYTEMSLVEIGKKLKITRERVRQIQIAALKRLSTGKRGIMLKGFLDEPL
jgi:RNA polymerase primary sigma factor